MCRYLEYSCLREDTGNAWCLGKHFVFGSWVIVRFSLVSPIVQTGNNTWAPLYQCCLHSCDIATFLCCSVSTWECPIIVGIRCSAPYSTLFYENRQKMVYEISAVLFLRWLCNTCSQHHICIITYVNYSTVRLLVVRIVVTLCSKIRFCDITTYCVQLY